MSYQYSNTYRSIYTGCAAALFSVFCFSACAKEIPAPESCTVSFSVPPGIYAEKTVQLHIEAPAGCTVYYTLDGSLPAEGSQKYEKELRLKKPGISEEDLTSPENAFKQTLYSEIRLFQDPALPAGVTVRAFSVSAAGEKSEVLSGTYFPGTDAQTWYPKTAVISIMTDDANLLDDETGILVKGNVFEAWKDSEEAKIILAEKKYAYVQANFTQKGREWERPVSLEIFDSESYIQQDAGIRVRGGYSRSAAQKSLNIYFRKDYGEKELTYELIPDACDTEGRTIGTYKSFTVRNGGNEWEYLKFKDLFLQELLAERAFDHQAGRPAVVFLNGEYWGIYTLCEKYSKTYIETHYPGIDGDNVIMIDEGELDEGEEEDLQLYEELLSYAGKDLRDPAVWKSYTDIADIQNMADYYAAEIYIANADWDESHNTRLWRTRQAQHTNEYDDGRWRFSLFDTEYSSGLYSRENTAAQYDSFAQALQDHPLFASMMRNQEFQERFLNSLRELGEETLAADRVSTLLKEYEKTWKPYMQDQYRRFGDTSWAWDRYIDRTREFFTDRYAYIMAYAETDIAKINDGE